MDYDLLTLSVIPLILLTASSIFLYNTIRPHASETKPTKKEIITEPSKLAKQLVSALPDSVLLLQDIDVFKQGRNAYWAQQECEIIPACIVQPRTVQELSTVVIILNKEYISQKNTPTSKGIFAIRGGGHSPVPGAASIKDGAVIDLRYLNSVKLSEDEKVVVIGGGAKWGDVSMVLDERGLAVVGGRNSAVGVGGLTLGGKNFLLHEYLSPEYLPFV
jgi:FAD/FMN-containing dehydrogenase